jgi:hypothetical protein
MRGHSTETVLAISHEGWKEKSASEPVAPGGMDVRTEAPLGCAVSQVVKTAQSRGRTERTLLFAGALAGRRNAADRLDPSLLMSHYCCYTQLITPTSADELPVIGGRCTGGAHRCKVKQGCREDRADVWILASKVVRFRGRVQSEKK